MPQQKGSLNKDGGSSKVGESSKGDGSQPANRKRKASFEQKSNARDLGTPKKPKNGGQGPNSQSVSKAGSNKRKVPGNEAREGRGNRNTQGKKPFKKQKGIYPKIYKFMFVFVHVMLSEQMIETSN